MCLALEKIGKKRKAEKKKNGKEDSKDWDLDINNLQVIFGRNEEDKIEKNETRNNTC